MLNVVIDNQTKNAIPSRQEIEDIAVNSINKLGDQGNNLELEILFVTPEKIRSLNKEYRNIDHPTDVLSFPQSNFKEAELNIFGSIIICPSIAEERSESIEELIKHGVLHLFGYDHETDEDEWGRAAKKINCKF